jgi:hypothetical protein
MSMVPNHFAVWLQSVVAAAPRNVRLIYIEWNNGRRGSRKVLWFSAFGYTIRNFDPEDSSSLSALSEWVWEAAEACATSPEVASDDEVLRRSIEELFAADPSILDPLIKRGGQIAFGRHESSVAVFPPPDRPEVSTCYYELDVASQSNHVEASGLDEFESKALDQVIEHRKFKYPFPATATFHLQPRGKELDLLWDVRYFVCSDRMRELIESATSKCQVFPINLYRSKKVDETKRIPGYYLINLYEQLSCLDPATVLPPPFKGFLPTFDHERGYRIVRAKAGKRDIFRIAYEYRRLVVSHAFRMKCERAGITSVEWLRRESV